MWWRKPKSVHSAVGWQRQTHPTVRNAARGCHRKPSLTATRSSILAVPIVILCWHPVRSIVRTAESRSCSKRRAMRRAVWAISMNLKAFFKVKKNVHASPGCSAAGASGLQTVGQINQTVRHSPKWWKMADALFGSVSENYFASVIDSVWIRQHKKRIKIFKMILREEIIVW